MSIVLDLKLPFLSLSRRGHGAVNSSPSVLYSASWQHLYRLNPVSCNSWLFSHQHITEFDTRNLESIKTSPSTRRLLFLLKGKQVRFPPGIDINWALHIGACHAGFLENLEGFSKTDPDLPLRTPLNSIFHFSVLSFLFRSSGREWLWTTYSESWLTEKNL